jgi:cysteine dioxygenase
MSQHAALITTVDQLVTSLKQGPGGRGYLEVLERIRIPEEEFIPFCRWNDKHYTRNCITRTPEFELLLLCYEPGQRTSIHDHATEEAWMQPVTGAVIEERYEAFADGPLRKVSSAKLDPGSFSYLHSGHSIHRYVNLSSGRSITLNLYARPLQSWKVYDERSGMPRSERIDGEDG